MAPDADGRGTVSALTPLVTHRERVLAAARPLAVETLAVTESAGSTLASAAIARLDIPSFDNSAMDGFAVRYDEVVGASEATPVRLRVVADVAAGSASDPTLGPGEAARIMTGAPVPTAADAIVPFEDTAGGLAASMLEATVVRAPGRRGAHIRRTAEDLANGDIALDAGTPLGALQLSALVAAGITEVSVARRPRVAVFSTGAELAMPGTVPAPGQIPDSNSMLLAGLVTESAGVVVARRSLGDDPDELLRAIADVDADVIVTSGGVSAGAYEPVRQALDGAIAFDRIAMQPGKPQGFGVLPSGALFFGLPGNPVSVAVSFEMFVRPALMTMQHRARIDRPRVTLPAAAAWRPSRGRTQILPIAFDGAGVRPATLGGSRSHLVGGLGRAEGYAIVPQSVESVSAGDPVDVMLVS